MKSHFFGALLGFLLGAYVTLVYVIPVQALTWGRTEAKSFVSGAQYEPYVLTGGWWSDDNIPTTPANFGNTRSEGVDCSGLVFKAWQMSTTIGSTSFELRNAYDDVHGPYQAASFYGGCSGACSTVCQAGSGTCPYTSTNTMDAFAVLKGNAGFTENHIGLIYSELSNGQDSIIQAIRPTITISTQSWRTKPGFRGIKRNGW